VEIASRATVVNRRAFVRSCAGAAATSFLPWPQPLPTLRFAILEISGAPRFGDGAALGYVEALQTAKLFHKGTIKAVHAAEHGLPVRVAGIATLLAQNGAQVIVAGLNDADARTAALECDRAGAIFINCGARGNDLRKEICSPLVFHVEASDAMYESARKLAPPGGDIALWSGRLEKYGAAQLNDRFGAAEGAPMRAGDWAGWFAIKVIWESFLRTGKADPVSLARYMSTDGVTFDGHKGAPLSFRTWDHQLRQPLYAMPRSSSAPPREIPDTSRPAGSIRDMLDTLGDSASAMKCIR
jgi:hypothetical protein